jgi:uncharacterized membrane protein
LAIASTDIGGIIIPSTSPAFLAVVSVHVAAALASVIAGAVAMLSRKRQGRHPDFGRIYYWALGIVALTALALAAVRWAEDYPLAVLALLAFISATVGRSAIRSGQPRPHIVGMGASYIVLLTAFYVDNGRFLPIWRDLHPAAYWLVPGAVGIPIIAWALWRHPLARKARPGSP